MKKEGTTQPAETSATAGNLRIVVRKLDKLETTRLCHPEASY